MSSIRSRDWCFTVNNYSDADIETIQGLSSLVVYSIVGKEVAGTGTPHLQGYLYFSDAKSFQKIQKLLPKGTHIEKAKGTPTQASEYCKKEGDFFEYGALPEKQGKRTDLDIVREMVSQGKTMNDVIDVAKNFQAIRTAEVLMKYREPKRNWKPTVTWIFGPSGCGKTKMAHELHPDLYRKTNSSGKWFDGYDAHKHVLIDDVKETTREYYSFLLELLDRYEMRVETKGSSRQFVATDVLLTSIWSPEQLFGSFLGAVELVRRIDKLIELK